MKRQLAAILYADVAGYSRLTGQNEEQTHQLLNASLTMLTDSITASGGSKVHEAGDAILAEFSSVTAAVDTAFEFQKSMVGWKSDLAEDERVRFRIGIHIGEVMRDRDDIYGDGVNIAARIEEIAQPGSLCVSSAPVFAWTAFPLDAVEFTREKLRYHRLSLIAEQGFCENYGSPVVWRSLKPKPAKFLVIATTCLENPEDFAPTWHQGVESQLPWFEIHDDLPRTRCEESPMPRSAWSSMGASDPDDWKALDYEKIAQLDDGPESH
jgi:hypothetical protein